MRPGGPILWACRALGLRSVVVLTAVLSVGCAPESDSMDGTEAMVARLRALPDSLDLRVARSLNLQRVEGLRALDLPNDPVSRLDYRRFLAGELIRAGLFEDANAQFDTIYEEIAPYGDRIAPEYRLSIDQLSASSYMLRVIARDCVEARDPERCVFPPKEPLSPESAADLRLAIERLTPSTLEAPEADDRRIGRLMLNVAHRLAGTEIEPELFIPLPYGATDADLVFRDIAPELDMDVFGRAGGAVMDDFDSDGDLDVMASSYDLDDPLRLFLNDGDGGFSDATGAAGLMGLVGGLQLRQADYDNDGDLDVFVLRGGWERGAGQPNSLLRNEGGARFIDVTEAAGLLEFSPTHTATWGDYDGDGLLDLFVGAEADVLSRPPRAHASRLYRNMGDGTFQDVLPRVGIGDPPGFVKGAVWGDYDNDGDLDLFLSRYKEPNLLYRNEGGWPQGTFVEVAGTAGVRGPTDSFPTWFWDYDNDGWLDLLVLAFDLKPWEAADDYLGRPHRMGTPALYRNRGDGSFEDVAAAVGLDRVFFTMGSDFGDLDADGFLDFYAGTGMPEMIAFFPNRMFRNVEGGRFEDVSSAGFAHVGKGHGVAFGDFDDDGDEDIYSVMGGANRGSRARNTFFLNEGTRNRSVTLRLRGTASNRSAIGARVEVELETAAGGTRSVHRRIGGGGSFGGSSLQLEIGLGDAASIRAVRISWPGSTDWQDVSGIVPGGIYEVVEGEATASLVREYRPR